MFGCIVDSGVKTVDIDYRFLQFTWEASYNKEFNVITGVNDSAENMLALARFLREKTSINRVELLPYHKLGLEKMTALGMPAVVFETPSETKMGELNLLLAREGIMTVSFK